MSSDRRYETLEELNKANFTPDELEEVESRAKELSHEVKGRNAEREAIIAFLRRREEDNRQYLKRLKSGEEHTLFNRKDVMIQVETKIVEALKLIKCIRDGEHHEGGV